MLSSHLSLLCSAVGAAEPKVRLCDMRTGSLTHTLHGPTGHTDYVYAVAWSPRNQHLLATGRCVGVWVGACLCLCAVWAWVWVCQGTPRGEGGGRDIGCICSCRCYPANVCTSSSWMPWAQALLFLPHSHAHTNTHSLFSMEMISKT